MIWNILFNVAAQCMQMHYNISSTSHFKGVFIYVVLKGGNGLYLCKTAIDNYLPKKFLNRDLD